MIGTNATLLTAFALIMCLFYCDSRPIFPVYSSSGKGVGFAEQEQAQRHLRSSFMALIGQAEFEDDVTVTPESERSESPNEQENENEEEEKPQNGLQVMITQKMKRILVDELKYLPNEIEDMEPQIAKVLIDRRLIRPKKGVPDNWRRKSVSNANNKRDWGRLRKHFSETLRDTITWTKSYVLPFLPAIVIGTTVWLQRDLLLGIAQGLWSRISIYRTRTEEDDDYRGSNNGWRLPQDTSSRTRSSKLDLKAYEKVRKPSFVDSITLRTKAWRSNNDW